MIGRNSPTVTSRHQTVNGSPPLVSDNNTRGVETTANNQGSTSTSWIMALGAHVLGTSLGYDPVMPSVTLRSLQRHQRLLNRFRKAVASRSGTIAEMKKVLHRRPDWINKCLVRFSPVVTKLKFLLRLILVQIPLVR